MLAPGMAGRFNLGGSGGQQLASHSVSSHVLGCEWGCSVLRVYWPEFLSPCRACSCSLSENGKVSEWSAAVSVVVQPGDRNHRGHLNREFDIKNWRLGRC